MSTENFTYYLDATGNLLRINGFYLVCDENGNNRLLKEAPPDLASSLQPIAPTLPNLETPVLGGHGSGGMPHSSRSHQRPISSSTSGPSPSSVESPTAPLPLAETSLNESASGGKARWTHNATLYLISTYEDKQNLITSNTIRRAEAWKEVAAQLVAAGFSYSAGQCECKFQSLKKLYLKKKDNMAAGSSGHERVDFTYFDELDKLFGKSPIVKPMAIASSSRANNHHGFTDQELSDMGVTEAELENMSIEDLEQLFPVKKKKNKKRNIDLVVDAIQEMDSKRQKRHNEIVSVLKEGQKDFRDIMTQLMSTLSQRQRQTSGGEDEI